MKYKALSLLTIPLLMASAYAEPLFVIADSIQKTETIQGLSYSGVTLAPQKTKTCYLNRAARNSVQQTYDLGSGCIVTVSLTERTDPFGTELVRECSNDASTVYDLGNMMIKFNGVRPPASAVGTSFAFTIQDVLEGNLTNVITYTFTVKQIGNSGITVGVVPTGHLSILAVDGVAVPAQAIGISSNFLIRTTAFAYDTASNKVSLQTSGAFTVPGDTIAFEKVSESSPDVASLNGNSLTAGTEPGWVNVRAVVTLGTGGVIASDPVRVFIEKGEPPLPKVAAADVSTPVGIPFTFPVNCPEGWTATVYPGCTSKPQGGLVLDGKDTYTLFFNYDGNRLFFLKEGEIQRLDSSRQLRTGMDLPINDFASIVVDPGKRFETTYWVDYYHVDQQGACHHVWSGPHKLSIADPTKI